MRGIKKLKTGDFNTISYAMQGDNSIIITLVKRGEGKVYKFKVKDLYGENEEVISEEVIEHKSRE